MHLIRIAIPTIILLGLSRRGLGAGGDGVSFHGTSHHFQDAIMADPASWTRRVGSSSGNAPWPHGLGQLSIIFSPEGSAELSYPDHPRP